MYKRNILVADLLKNERHITKLMRGGKCIYSPLQEYKEERPSIKARLTLSDGSTVDIPFVDENDHTLYDTETSGYRGTCIEAEVFDGVTTLNKAFGNFSAMTSVTITDDVTTFVNSNTFCDCHVLKRINSNADGVFNLPKNLSGALEQGILARCYQMEAVVIPSGVTSIGNLFAQNSSKLKTIISLANPAPTIANNTFNGIPTSGTIYYQYGVDYSGWMRTDNYYLGKYGWHSRPCDYITPMLEPVHFIAEEDNVTFTPVGGVSYSIDGGNSWSVADGSTTLELNTSEEIYLKASNVPFSATSVAVATSGKMSVRGNAHSLVYGDNYLINNKLTSPRVLNAAFKGITGLTDAIYLNLPAVQLSNNCYDQMFMDCTSLTGAPRLAEFYTPLSAYCYSAMFFNCTSLKNAPILRVSSTPANECCRKMFNGCSSLSAMALTFVPTTARTFEWVAGVASAGNFLIDSSSHQYLNRGTTSTSPAGWKIIQSSTGGTGSLFNASRAS